MALKIKLSLLVLHLLLIYSLSSGMAEGFSDNIMNTIYSLHTGGVKVKYSRKLLVTDTVLDYDYTGPNPKHDPRKGKPGGSGGKSP